MLLYDPIPMTKPGQHVHALGRELPHRAFERKGRQRSTVDGFDESSIHEALTYRSGHLLGHGERGRRGRRDDPGLIFRIGHPVRLGEFEGSQVVDGFLGREGMLDFLKAHPVSGERKADHQGREEIFKISGERPFFIRHAEQAG